MGAGDVLACTKCKEEKTARLFNFRNKAEGIRHRMCQDCTRKATMSAYVKKRSYYIQVTAQWKQRQREKMMNVLFDYFRRHPCVDCSVNDPVVLQFDHVRGRKREDVSTMVRMGYSAKAIMQEIRKCDVRCANCHARRTARERKYYAYMDSLP